MIKFIHKGQWLSFNITHTRTTSVPHQCGSGQLLSVPLPLPPLPWPFGRLYLLIIATATLQREHSTNNNFWLLVRFIANAGAHTQTQHKQFLKVKSIRFDCDLRYSIVDMYTRSINLPLEWQCDANYAFRFFFSYFAGISLRTSNASFE